MSDTTTVAVWSGVSRATGLLRMIAIGAVLGPTYLGNTFQGMQLVPSLLYEFLTGSLLISLLVPPLVRHLEQGGARAAQSFASAVMGVLVLAFGVLTAVFACAAPLVLTAFSSSVRDSGAAAEQRAAGLVLLLLFLPQMVFYGIAAVGSACMNAQGRFALPAAAPAVENMGTIATLIAVGLIHGTGRELSTTDTGMLVLLGLGTTASVALHAATQWVGAVRVGIRLVPDWRGWRHEECRLLLRRLLPSLGYAALNATRVFVLVLVANRLAGGVLALQLARNLRSLPVALVARPAAVALLPRMAGRWSRGDVSGAHAALTDSARLTALLAVPSGMGLLALSWPLARAFAVGEMSSQQGRLLVFTALAALALSVVGESLFVLYTHASYAMDDPQSPLVGMVTRASVTACAVAIALVVPDGPIVLLALGLGITLGDLIGANHLRRRVLRRIGRHPGAPSGGNLAVLAASAVMSVPALAMALVIPSLLPGQLGPVLGVVAGVVTGALVFVAVQWPWRRHELLSTVAALRGGSTRTADETPRRHSSVHGY